MQKHDGWHTLTKEPNYKNVCSFCPYPYSTFILPLFQLKKKMVFIWTR